MKLLVFTQIVDRTDATLGFFTPWIEELSKRVEHIEVVCLKKAEFSLPENVKVHSLGKESVHANRLIARFTYIWRFYIYLFCLQSTYDRVFVHMNHEYVLLGGWYWWLLGKPIYLWRNHYQGSAAVDLAAVFCKKIFCTSTYSYTASFPQTVIMPVGVNVESLNYEIPVSRVPNSILTLGRLSPSKKPEFLLEVYALLKKRGLSFTATFVGGEHEEGYQKELEDMAGKLDIQDRVTFVGAVSNTETFRYYRSAEIFVNASKSGMLDKTMFKAMAAGDLLISSSKDLMREMSKEFVFEEGNIEDLADKLAFLLELSEEDKKSRIAEFEAVVARNSLPVLADKLITEMEL